MTGFIYAIECAGRIKLGFSAKPEARFTKVASDSPFPCQLLGYWPGTGADELEIHAKFNSIRQYGEWFDATPELLEFVTRVALPLDRKNGRLVVTPSDRPLAAWRKRQGMTQTELAEMLGCSTSAVCWLEAGKNGTTLAQALKIQALAGDAVPLESLLPEEAA